MIWPLSRIVNAPNSLPRMIWNERVAPEAAVIRTHLDWIVSLPWTGRSDDNLDVSHASAVLESEHFGLNDLSDLPVLKKPDAIQANKEIFSDPANLEGIVRFRTQGKFPWEA